MALGAGETSTPTPGTNRPDEVGVVRMMLEPDVALDRFMMSGAAAVAGVFGGERGLLTTALGLTNRAAIPPAPEATKGLRLSSGAGAGDEVARGRAGRSGVCSGSSAPPASAPSPPTIVPEKVTTRPTRLRRAFSLVKNLEILDWVASVLEPEELTVSDSVLCGTRRSSSSTNQLTYSRCALSSGLPACSRHACQRTFSSSSPDAGYKS